jgi:hypothetical protein
MTVYTVLQRFKTQNTVVSPKQTGWPYKLSDRDKRSMGHLVSQDRRLPLAEIISNLPEKVALVTTRKAFHSLGYHSYIAAKKPFINKKQRVARLAFTKLHKDWTVDDLKRIIWTDKSSFETSKFSCQIRVWRKLKERYDPACLAPSFKSGRSSVMVWGAFVNNETLPLVVMPPRRRTATDFVQIIYEPILGPYLDAHLDARNLTLMEDGAPIH